MRFWIWNFGIWDFVFCILFGSWDDLEFGILRFVFFFKILFFFSWFWILDLVFLVTAVTVVRAAAVLKGGVCLPKGERVA